MAVLYMVGDGLEEPLQAKRLLDLELFPKKPHFAKALDTPLVLHDCIYDRLDFQWLPENLWRVQQVCTLLCYAMLQQAAVFIGAAATAHIMQCAAFTTSIAHLEAQWEEATLRATRVMNALEFIAEAPVRRCDVRDMLEKRARAATGGQQYYQGSAETAAAQLAALVREAQQDAAVAAQVAAAAAAAASGSSSSDSGATVAALPENHGKLAWADALSRISASCKHTKIVTYMLHTIYITYYTADCMFRAAGFDPEHSGRKHVPLEQRVMDKSYEQRISDIQQGTSQRKARLDKNLAMQTRKAASMHSSSGSSSSSSSSSNATVVAVRKSSRVSQPAAATIVCLCTSIQEA
eukprot:12925-Heterococcus_DN1.PRE.4